MGVPKVSEHDIQRAILDWLAAKHITAIRLNTGAMKGSHKGKGWYVKFGVPGMADILAFPQIKISLSAGLQGVAKPVMTPLPTWIEVKAPKGVQSPLQRSFQEKMESEGHLYILARSLDDVEKVLG